MTLEIRSRWLVGALLIALTACGGGTSHRADASITPEDRARLETETRARVAGPWGSARQQQIADLSQEDALLMDGLTAMAEHGNGAFTFRSDAAAIPLATAFAEAGWFVAGPGPNTGQTRYTLTPRGAVGLPQLLAQPAG